MYTTVTAESVPSAELVHTKFYGYGGICSIGAADAHETFTSGLTAVIQRHAVEYARKPSVVHLPSNLWLQLRTSETRTFNARYSAVYPVR